MNATLRALAELYRQSSAGRFGGVRDFTYRWEDFLRENKWDDGDVRELAEHELLEAERASGKMLQIDRHKRSGAKETIRLKLDGGEAWLFAVTGFASPMDEREQLASFFQAAAAEPVPDAYRERWSAYFDGLASRASEGASVLPFKRDSATGNALLLRALVGLFNWQGESLVRYASTVLLGDSKALESLRPRLVMSLREITGKEEADLEDFGITDTPRSVWIHGPLVLDLSYGRIDFGALSGPAAISATDLAAATSIETSAPLCLTVENHTVFRELLKSRTGVLLVQTSFPGAATRLLFEKLPQALACHHFGDSDPSGYDILRDLREKTGRFFAPMLMPFRPDPDAPPLTAGEKKDIARLLASPVVADIHPELEAMLAAGTKGFFEQESCPIRSVVDHLTVLSNELSGRTSP